MMTQGEFITKATLALYQNTTYATGAFGASIGNFPAQLTRYCKNSPDLEKTIRARAAIRRALRSTASVSSRVSSGGGTRKPTAYTAAPFTSRTAFRTLGPG